MFPANLKEKPPRNKPLIGIESHPSIKIGDIPQETKIIEYRPIIENQITHDELRNILNEVLLKSKNELSESIDGRYMALEKQIKESNNKQKKEMNSILEEIKKIEEIKMILKEQPDQTRVNTPQRQAIRDLAKTFDQVEQQVTVETIQPLIKPKSRRAHLPNLIIDHEIKEIKKLPVTDIKEFGNKVNEPTESSKQMNLKCSVVSNDPLKNKVGKNTPHDLNDI